MSESVVKRPPNLSCGSKRTLQPPSKKQKNKQKRGGLLHYLSLSSGQNHAHARTHVRHKFQSSTTAKKGGKNGTKHGEIQTHQKRSKDTTHHVQQETVPYLFCYFLSPPINMNIFSRARHEATEHNKLCLYNTFIDQVK